MALQLNKEYRNTGIICNYHNLKKKDIRIDATDGSGSVTVRTYLTNAARQANKEDVMNKTYQLPAGTFSTLNLATTDLRDPVYIYLKTLPDFTGSIDV